MVCTTIVVYTRRCNVQVCGKITSVYSKQPSVIEHRIAYIPEQKGLHHSELQTLSRMKYIDCVKTGKKEIVDRINS